MENRKESNNTLFFIVGGLVVLALIFGFIFFDNNANDAANVAPASGYSAMDTNSDTSRTETDLNINDDGVNGSVTDTNTDTNSSGD